MEDSAGYKKLIVWQRADELAYFIYQLTERFPKTEIYALSSQLRRAALSVPTNIVEGYARNNKKEFRRFVIIALGSLAEVKYLLMFAFRLEYIHSDNLTKAQDLTETTGQLLWKFYKSL